MADNEVNMGWGDADEAPNGAEGDARAAGAVQDGADGGLPRGGGEQEEAEEIGDGGQLKYVSFMAANAATNAGIAEKTVSYIKWAGVDPGGDMDTVMLGGEQAPFATFWGSLEEITEKTADVMVIGSDPATAPCSASRFRRTSTSSRR